MIVTSAMIVKETVFWQGCHAEPDPHRRYQTPAPYALPRLDMVTFCQVAANSVYITVNCFE